MPDNPYQAYVDSLQTSYEDALRTQLPPVPKGRDYPLLPEAPKVLLLAPHPDDECVMGGLPLRLHREAGCRVVTLPVTLGSNPDRKRERKQELQNACEYLGFELDELVPLGLDEITPSGRKNHSSNWAKSVETLCQALDRHAPSLLFFPNPTDWNQTHLGVNLLTLEALQKTSTSSLTLIETEFWGQMSFPNLLVESTTQEVIDLVSALSMHRGEVERNPFHLRLPAWMQDNVRRGAEVIGGQGEKAPSFQFATPYRVTRVENGNFFSPWEKGRMLPSSKKKGNFLLDQISSS